MIARLKGMLDHIADDSVVIDVGGVGYLVFCSARTLAALPAVGTAISLHIDTHVREDHIHLYGFPEVAERDWFRLLTTVQGVGTRVAMAILGILAPDALANALAARDEGALTRADGVGPKLARRIVMELKDKAGALAFAPVTPAAEGTTPIAAAKGVDPVIADAVSALVNLGYGRAEAFGAVAQVGRTLPDAGLDALIPAALKELAQ